MERSLVKVEKNNKLQMHDLLRDMGRAIVGECSEKEPAKHSRLWFHEDVLDVLLNNTGPKASNHSLRSLVIGIGSSQVVMDMLGKSLSQGLAANSSDSFLPGDNYPLWLAYTCEGPS
ncbi:hypothetical protein KIW84_046130 [Lathyrus oleraceus]|uniref:Disease resistance protein Roq1-like winged-helix domain-containing protein n=1 Tax=Pisum sativum TaxID=3888 RepID=A0A9D4XL25_PEA|nr:hypothetical protein KIW84_046130 [Pisum sativum]